MFSSLRNVTVKCKSPIASFITRCEADMGDQKGIGDFDSNNAFLTDSVEEEQKPKGPIFRSPMAFENLMGVMRQGSVNNYDGFRVIVQKQINMNTVASHFYWIGSQSAPPIYQYRLILPFDDKVVNVATDMDFNIEGEMRVPLAQNLNAKGSFTIHEQHGNNLTVDLDLTDESSATQLQYSPTQGHTLSMSYMQSMSKSLILGGMAEYVGSKHTLQTSFGGAYDDGDNVVAAQWDTNVSTTISNGNGDFLPTPITASPSLKHMYLRNANLWHLGSSNMQH